MTIRTESKIFFLEPDEGSKIIRIFQGILGIMSVLVSGFWILFSIRSDVVSGTIVITEIFLFAFGFYMIMSGIGFTRKYIETKNSLIKLKRYSVLPPLNLEIKDIRQVEILPLSICFKLNNQKKKILRFGITFPEIIEPVKQSIIDFASQHNIKCIIKEEI